KVVYDIQYFVNGIATTITADDFKITNTDSTTSGYYSAAHVQDSNGGSASTTIAANSTEQVDFGPPAAPEPSAFMLAFGTLGLGMGWALRNRLRGRTAAVLC